MRRRLLLGGVAGGMLAACDRSSPGPKATAEFPPLRLSIGKWPGFLAAGLADALGWFHEHSLRLDVHFQDTTQVHLADFLAGQYDAMGFALGDLLMFSRNQSSARVLLATDESSGADALLMRRGTPVKATGRLRVGFTQGSYGNLFVEEFLNRQGIASGTWEKVEADASEVPEMLLRKQIDVGHTWEPYLSRGLAQGLELAFSSRDTPGLVVDVLVVTPSGIARREADLRTFVKLWFHAVDWWLARPEEAAVLIAKRLGLEAAEVKLDGLRLLTLAENRRLLAPGDGEDTLGHLVSRYSDFFVSRGVLTKPVSSSQLLGPGLLP
jgi:NitT/TauT family transport system substrate-binding protein